MAKLNVPFGVAMALYEAACKVRDGDRTVLLADLGETFQALFPELDAVCSTIEPWQRGKTLSGTDNFVMAGPGWKVSFKIASDTGQPETALIDRDEDETYVLEGDHRDAFEAVRDGGMPALLAEFIKLEGGCRSEFSPSVPQRVKSKYGLDANGEPTQKQAEAADEPGCLSKSAASFPEGWKACLEIPLVSSTQVHFGVNFTLKVRVVEAVAKMVESVRVFGVQKPLKVVSLERSPGHYQVIDGDVRLAAVLLCEIAGIRPRGSALPIEVVGTARQCLGDFVGPCFGEDSEALIKLGLIANALPAPSITNMVIHCAIVEDSIRIVDGNTRVRAMLGLGQSVPVEVDGVRGLITKRLVRDGEEVVAVMADGRQLRVDGF